MRFAFTDDQLAFRDAVKSLFDAECGPAVVRASWESESGLNPGLWEKLGDMGVLGILAPEVMGGLGLSFIDLILILEEAGYAGLPDPIVEHVAVALPLLVELRADDRIVADAIAGREVVGVSGFDMSPYVLQANVCRTLIARTSDGTSIVESPGANTERLETIDRSVRMFRVSGLRSSQESPTGAVGPAESAGLASAAFNRGALGTAAVLVGAARRCLDLTVGYISQREQFGVPVGSFQGLKHQMATALMQLEFARPAVYRAAQSITSNESTVDRDVSMAKAMASDAARLVARTSLQAHGAIGYTVEYDLHLWFKRIFTLAPMWGDSAWHTDRVGVALGI